MPKRVKNTSAAVPQTDSETNSKVDSKVESRKASWWQTLAGILTATTAIITAVAGLLVALHQVGLLGNNTNPSAPSVTTTSQPRSATAPPATPASNNATYAVGFPSGTTVKFRNSRGEGTYEILAAQAERRSVGKLGLTLTIRMTNNGPADVGFYTDTFRLLVDGVPRAPVNQLIDSVDARSAEESAIEFEMPETVNSLALQVLVGDSQEDTADIAITIE